MKTALMVLASLATLLLVTAPSRESAPSRGRPQLLAVEVSALRAEYAKGWQHSFYVHMDDTWGEFVTQQANHLMSGEYSDLVPAVRDQAESMDRDTPAGITHPRPGGWEPLGWGECERELLLFRRRLR